MNRNYRHVWNKAQGRYVVAAENASSPRGGRGNGGVVLATATALSFLAAGSASAQMVTAGGKTEVYRSANGVQIVNIDAANAAGLSHNKFTQYNVETSGVVLNNGNTSQLSRNSQLAGQVLSNRNLGSEAKVILNEVVAANRSTLRGFTEVVGSKADVVLANPWGITCNGCGFINTNRAVMSTGAPQFGADGALTGFRTTMGEILVEGNGMDATGVSTIDLVARSVRLDGKITAQDLGVSVGANQWTWADRSAVAITGDGTKPLYAFDASALGGMYANRIAVVATEAGVGVRMLGEAAASADDFTLTANGRIELQGRVSAARDLAIRQAQEGAADGFQMTGANASLSAGRDMTLAASGGMLLSDGSIKAEGNLGVSAQSLVDQSTQSAAATRAATGNATVSVANAATLNNTSWSAQQALRMSTGSLSVGAGGATLAAGANTGAADRALAVVATLGDIDLSGASVNGAQDVWLDAQQGAVKIGAGASQGVAAGQDAIIWADTVVDNQGSIGAVRNVQIAAKDAATTLAVKNAGKIEAVGVAVTGTNGARNVTLDNAAKASIAATGELRVEGQTLKNAGTLQGGAATVVNLDGAADNVAGGQILAQNAGGTLAVQAASLANAGTVQSRGTLDATLGGALTQVSTGAIQTLGADQGGAGGTLTVKAASLDNAGTVSGAGTLTADTTGAIANTGTLQSKSDAALTAGTRIVQEKTGQVLAGQAATLKATALDNAGRVQAERGVVLGGVERRMLVDNQATGIVMGDTVDAWVTDLSNAGTAQALAATLIDASGKVVNATTGTLTASVSGNGYSIVNAVGQVSNDGAINASGGVRVNAYTVNNNGKMKLKDVLAIQAVDGITNSSNIESEKSIDLLGSWILNNGYVAASSSLQTTMATATTNTGTLHGGTRNTITTAALDNSGDIKSGGTVAIKSTDTVRNTRNVLADGAMDIVTNKLDNAAGAMIGAGAVLNVNSTSGVMTLNNAGTVQSASAMNLGRAAQRVALTNQAGGKIQSGDSLTAYGTAVRNEAGARMQWMGNGVIDANSLTNVASNSVVIGGIDDRSVHTSEIKLSGAFSNAGAVHSGGDLTVLAASVNNTNTAGLSALNDLTVTASNGGESLRNAGAFYAGRDMRLTANAGGLINAGDEGTMDAERNIVMNARDVTNQGAVRAENITVNATNSFTNQPVGALPEVYVDYSQVVSSRELSTTNISKYNCFLGSNCDYLDVTDYEIKFNEKLRGEMPTFVAQMLANETLTVNYGNSGKNMAGLLSAKNIKIAGTGTFVNEDFYLDTITYVQRTAHYYSDDFWSSDDFEDWYAASETQFNNKPWESGEDIHWGTGGQWTSYGGAGLVGTTLNGKGETVWAAYLQERDRTMQADGKTSAGIYAANFDFQGGILSVRASPNQPKRDADKPVDKQSTSASGTTIGGISVGGVGGVGAIVGKSATAAVATKAASGVTLGGVTIKLPTNPNGYYVTTKTPGAKYLVETNPLFQTTSSFLSSDYLANELGIDPEETIQRLGDANYEAYLVRQQLIQQTGKNLLDQTKSEAAQLEQLYKNAATSAKDLGLTYGQPLTDEQIAALDGDIVWMVETEVDGVKVLAPVVYLSQASKDAITGGGIVASNTTINADSVENTGGTIGGTSTLNITAKNDIVNTSGTITGGNVKLTSTEGSIVNQTYARTTGDDVSASTSIGKTGSITATGTLGMDAKNDIKIIGADVTAKDATLAAGGAITVDTIVDKTTTSSTSRSSGFLSSSTTNTSTTTANNIGSNLNIGNNLTLKSGGDTTIAGSNVNVGGNLNADTGGDFNVLARQDTVETSTSTSTAGVGVGGGLYGSSTTTTDKFKGTNSGSTLTVGGNANVKSEGTMTVQGSDVNIGGNADIDAKKGIAILDGLDEEHTSTHTETTTFGKIGGNSAAEATASAASKAGAGRNAAAEASANASGSLKLAEKTTTDSASGSTTSVASTFNVGGNANLKTDGTLTVQGSDVKAGGDLAIDANSVQVLTGRNTTYASTTSTSDSIGFYGEAGAKAGASASNMGAMGSAQASAEAESTLTVGARTENASFATGSTTNRGSTLSGGGNVTIKAKEDATFVGANVNAGGDLSVDAKNINSMAAQDTTYETSSADTKTAGLYLSAGADASAKANNTGASAQAGAEASAGLRYAQTSEGSSSGSVTQQTSSFTAGGNVNRNASGTITDQGTQIEAGGNINQSANEIKEVAAHNSTWETSNASSLDARLGVYAGASAGASTSGGADADASVGFKASVAGGTESSSSSSSTAVTSRYKAGGDINSTSTNGTTLIGTQFESGGNVNINAGSLDYQAARDTTSSSSSNLSGSAEAKVGVLGTAGVSGELEVEGGKSSSSSSTARAGGINAGGAINVNTKGNATFEGTNLAAGNGVNVGAGGDVNFNAATSTAESSGFSAGLSLSGGTSGSGSSKESNGAFGASAQGTYSTSTTQTGSNIAAGAGGVNISSGNNVNLQGTQVKTSGATNVSAGGTVNTSAAESSSVSVGAGIGIGGGAATSSKGSISGGGVGIGLEAGGSSSSQGVNIQSGGGTSINNNVKVEPSASVVAPTSVAIAAAPTARMAAAPTATLSRGAVEVAPTSVAIAAAPTARMAAAPTATLSRGAVEVAPTSVAIAAAPTARMAAAPTATLSRDAVAVVPAATAVAAAPAVEVAAAPAVKAAAPALTKEQAAKKKKEEDAKKQAGAAVAAPAAAVAPAVAAPTR